MSSKPLGFTPSAPSSQTRSYSFFLQ
jgi:hypothetical protein